MRADVTVNLNLRPEVRREWENLRKHDVCFVLTVRPPSKIGTFYDFQEQFVPQVRRVACGQVRTASCGAGAFLQSKYYVAFDGGPRVLQVGLTYVRGCEIEGMLDENGRVIEEGETGV